MQACTLEMKRLGHSEDDCASICSQIRERAQKGALLKAQSEGLQVLSKADEEDIVVGGYASWDMVDDDGDTFTVDAQSKALERFFAQAPEYQLITIDHGRGLLGEIKAAQPQLKYVNKAGESFFSHVNEAGTYLISRIRNDALKSTQYIRGKAKAGELNGYSVNAVPLIKDPTDPHRVLDMEYTAITITEKGKFRPRNPMTRDVKVLSKANMKVSEKASEEEIKTKLLELKAKKQLLQDILWSSPKIMEKEATPIQTGLVPPEKIIVQEVIPEELRRELQTELDLLYLEISAYEEAYRQKIITSNKAKSEAFTPTLNTEEILNKYGFNRCPK